MSLHSERLDNKQVFAEMAPGAADGLRCDIDGNLWAGAGWVGEGYDGVHIFAPDGTLIGKDSSSGNLCEYLFRRRKTKQALYDREPISLFSLCECTRGPLLLNGML